MWCRAPGCSSHTHPVSFFLFRWGMGGRGVRMFTMLWNCLLPSLSASAPDSDQRQKEKDIGVCVCVCGGGMVDGASHLSSFPPSVSFRQFLPSSTLTFIFLVFACPLKAKGLCALYVNVCVWGSQTASGCCIRQRLSLSMWTPSLCCSSRA